MKILEIRQNNQARREAELAKKGKALEGLQVSAEEISRKLSSHQDEMQMKSIIEAAKDLIASSFEDAAKQEQPASPNAKPKVKQKVLPTPTTPSEQAPNFQRQSQNQSSNPSTSALYSESRYSRQESAEKMANHPLIAFLKGETQRLEITQGVEIERSEIGELLAKELVSLAEDGYLFGSRGEAEAAELLPLRFIHIGPVVSRAERFILASLVPTSAARKSPSDYELLVSEQNRLFFKRLPDSRLSNDNRGGLTTIFNSSGVWSSAGRIFVSEGKRDAGSSTVAQLVPVPIKDTHSFTQRVQRDILSNEIPMPVSSYILGVTLAGIDRNATSFYRFDEYHEEFHHDQLLVMPFEPTDTHQKFTMPSRPIDIIVNNTMDALKPYNAYGPSDMTVVFTEQTVNSLLQSPDSINFGITRRQEMLPRIAVVGAKAKELAERILKANKESGIIILTPQKDKQHQAKSYPSVFDGKSFVTVYPYYFKPGFMGGVKPYTGYVRSH